MKKTRLYRPVLLIFLLTCIVSFSQSRAQIYLDSTATIEERVTDLLGRMTLDEKIGQMTQAERGALQSQSDIRTYFLGSLLSGGGSAPADASPTGWADMYDAYQSQALQTPLGIPLIYGVDAVHGHNNVRGAVIFPHNIGLGCTRNADLVEEAARVTAAEVAGTGIDWTFAPCIAVPRNERWGRTYEGFGETPELAQIMSAAAVRGFQGDTLSGGRSILACAKHYMGDGGTTDGRDQGNTQVDEATLREIHLPGYIAAIGENVGSIMASFNSWNGEKLHGHHYLLTTVLKEELGFEGFVVSDWAGITQLPGNNASQVEASINAGIDMVMVPNEYIDFITTLRSLVQQGKVSEDRIDDAVARILRAKFQLRLFEHPLTSRALTDSVGSDDHREVARRCVRESLVLLKKKDGILPLSKDGVTIHVAGSNADDLGNQCGGWSITWQGSSGDITEGTTILEAIENTVQAGTVTFSETGTGAGGADIGIAVIGETPYAEGAGDRSDLNLSNSDIMTVRNLKDAGIPVVTILISGRPMILEPILHYSDVLIAAWLPGTEGQGVADILFGDVEPTGLLNHSWPRDMSQIPINLGDTNYHPLYEYGHGMTSLEDSEAGSPPLLLSAAVSGNGYQVELSFNKTMAASYPDAEAFSLRVNLFEVRDIASVTRKPDDPTTVVLTLDIPLEREDIAVVSYTAGFVASEDGGPLASFADEPVYNGLEDVRSALAVPGKIEAEAFSDMSGVQTEVTTDQNGGLNVGWIDSGDWMDYLVDVQSSGQYTVSFRIASQSQSGQIQVLRSETTLATVILPVTGGWQNWQTATSTVFLTEGEQHLRFFAGRGGFNVNWIEFTYEGGSSFLHQEGPDIIDGQGQKILLRGYGLGGWLVPEGYILKIPGFGSPSSIRAKIEYLIGPADTEEFYARYRNTYVNEDDIELIASWGFNSIRLPFNYRMLSPEDQPGVYLEEGFQIIDQLLEWCEARQMYVILDMHCCPGGQNAGNISDSDGIEARLWTNESNKTRTVDIWRTIAERYADEEWIGGYDLINEPVLPDGYSNADLMALYQDIVAAIREVDTNHMVFLEGEYWATNFDLLTPPFDSNMAYSFHKYWSTVNQSSIQSYVNIRNQYSVPLWMGESGENSNPWFFDFVHLLETNDIGWNWWTHKKLETLTSPLSAPVPSSYRTLINYWNGQGEKPSAAFAKSALLEMADNLLLENCTELPGVLQALTRSDFDQRTIPFSEHHLPGRIDCAEYDFGDAGLAYKDTDFQNINGGSWNNGWTYRNDGVDIEVCSDPYGADYNVGWTETGEWLLYTVLVDQSGLYDVEFRIASQNGGGKVWLLLDSQPLTDVVSIPVTGGVQSWDSVTSPAGSITAGEHTLKMMIVTGGFNINFVRFIQTGELTRGDTDGNGDVNVLDVLFVLNIILHIVDPTPTEMWLADCTGNGSVDILDALGIVNVILGLGTCQP